MKKAGLSPGLFVIDKLGVYLKRPYKHTSPCIAPS